jgi:prephenate dehydrogenase
MAARDERPDTLGGGAIDALSGVEMPPVLVVGLGLIGGSVGLALGRRGVRVRGVTRSEDTLHKAIELGAVEGGSLELADEAPGAGLVLVAAPTRTSIRLLEAAAALAPPGTILTDACSSKQEVVRAMDGLPDHVRAVGGHPMAGKEASGVEAADADLFEGATWVLTETRRTDPGSRATCERLARLCGAEPLWLGASEHDRAVASVSHLPLLTAAALVLAAEDAGSELVWRLAASGFRDSTRLAAGEPGMGADLALTNAAALSEAYELFAGQLEALVSAARRGEEVRLRELLARAAARRQGMYGGEQ